MPIVLDVMRGPLICCFLPLSLIDIFLLPAQNVICQIRSGRVFAGRLVSVFVAWLEVEELFVSVEINVVDEFFTEVIHV